MNKLILLGLLLVNVLCSCKDDFEGVRKLVDRRTPWLSDHIRFVKSTATDKETFTLRSEGDRLVVEASNANAAAVGVNWYLKYYCHRNMSHLGDNLEPVTELPVLTEPVTRETGAQCRYALNYCTYNYSMSFYTWKDWERELDWMALNGVNLMLVANGAEAVWQNTLRRLGYTEQEITDYIPGPAYTAWWLMGNLEGWGGPMPQSQIDSRKETVQKMLSRMKELGIQPLMPGFYGMIPSNYKEKSQAHIIPQGKWCTFTRPDILDPTDPEFQRIADIFYEETRNLYGDDLRFFSGDPFHEGGIAKGVDLGEAGLAIQQAMQKHFPGAVWVLQGWQNNPKPELLAKLDKNAVLVQELFGENTQNWEKRKGYEGTPFIWATVTNFGERPGINGKLQRFADEIYRASNSEYAPYMKGVGILPEGIINNPVAYELVLESVWHPEKINMNEWIEEYCPARYGKANEKVKTAWQIFLNTIYSSEVGYQEGPPENILCARPGLNITHVSSWGKIAKRYDIDQFRQGVEIFAEAFPELKESRTYRIDLIHFLRQVLANEADSVFARMVTAYQQKKQPAFGEAKEQWTNLLDTENELLAQDPMFRLSTYQNQALNAGNTEEEKNNNLKNAMALITYWGGNIPEQDYLRDYAYKEWAGLMNHFYKQRWNMYFEYLSQPNPDKAKALQFYHWERTWAADHCKVIDDSPKGSLEEVMKQILQ